MRNRTVSVSLIAALAAGLCGQGFLPARAQPPSAPAAPAQPATLAEALKDVYWPADERGPLLVVAPDVDTDTIIVSVSAAERKARDAARPTVTKTREGYRVPELADRFGRRVVRLRGVTVLAPARMVLLNDAPGKPGAEDSLARYTAVLALQVSLTPEQWRRYGSEAGLGESDLTDEQRPLFDACLPDPFVVEQVRANAQGNDPWRDGVPTSVRTLSEGERARVRLRMNRKSVVHFRYQGDKTFPDGDGEYLPDYAPGEAFYRLAPTPPRDPRTYAGVVLSKVEPSRLKPSQIDFDAAALAPAVALDGAATVGDLVQRIRAATGVALYADPRLALLPVWMRAAASGTVRAGELLRALCWSVTGAVRQVGDGRETLFVLTDDVEGFGLRMARIVSWTHAVLVSRYQRRQMMQALTRQRGSLDAIGFAADDPLALAPEQMAKVAAKWTSRSHGFDEVRFDTSALPAALRDAVRERAAALNAARAGKPVDTSAGAPFAADAVDVRVSLSTTYLLPGGGSVSLGSLTGPGDFLPPDDPDSADPDDPNGAAAIGDTVRLPPAMTMGVVLCAAPCTEDEAAEIVRAARRHGVRQVWIAPPPEEDEDAAAAGDDALSDRAHRILAAAIGAAKAPLSPAAGGRPAPPAAVSAVVRLLSRPPRPDAKPGEAADRFGDVNVAGDSESVALRKEVRDLELWQTPRPETVAAAAKARDWLDPAVPGVAGRVVRRLKDVAAVPGLAGLVLVDPAPPGYGTPDSGSGVDPLQPLGYTPARRLALIRAIGCDPIDLADRRGLLHVADGPVFFTTAVQYPLMRSASSVLPPARLQALGQGLIKGELNEFAPFLPNVAWNALRWQSERKLLSAVYDGLADVRARRPDFAVILERIDPDNGWDWYASWDAADAPPTNSLGGGDVDLGDVSAGARKASKRLLLTATYRSPEEEAASARYGAMSMLPPSLTLPPVQKFAHDVNRVLRDSRAAHFDGIVLDLRGQPFRQVLTLLDALGPARQ